MGIELRVPLIYGHRTAMSFSNELLRIPPLMQ